MPLSARSLIFERIAGAISPEDADRIEAHLLSDTFPWFFNQATVLYPETSLPAGVEDFGQFTHTFNWGNGMVPEKSAWVMDCFDTPAFNSIISECRATERIKANLQLSRGRPILSPAHYDSDVPSVSVIYYVNDSDGDTIFYDRRRGDDDLPGLSEIARATPRKGDCVVFSGDIYHSPSHPVRTSCRSVINFVFNL